MIEALVAITVLTIGVTGVLSLLAQSLVNADYAKNQITAFFLAQEGQELVIGKRNINRLQGKTSGVNILGSVDEDGANEYWLDGMRRCSTACSIGTADNVGTLNQLEPKRFELCEGGLCPVMRLNDNGFYGYNEDGEDTIFTRTIAVDPFDPLPNDDDEERMARVTVTVTWRDRPASPDRSFTLNSIIFR